MGNDTHYHLELSAPSQREAVDVRQFLLSGRRSSSFPSEMKPLVNLDLIGPVVPLRKGRLGFICHGTLTHSLTLENFYGGEALSSLLKKFPILQIEGLVQDDSGSGWIEQDRRKIWGTDLSAKQLCDFPLQAFPSDQWNEKAIITLLNTGSHEEWSDFVKTQFKRPIVRYWFGRLLWRIGMRFCAGQSHGFKMPGLKRVWALPLDLPALGTSEDNWASFYYAIGVQARPACFKLLVKLEQNIARLKDWSGVDVRGTFLEMAVTSNNRKTARLMLELGARPERAYKQLKCVSAAGYLSSLDYARINGHINMLRLLEQFAAGSNTSFRSNLGDRRIVVHEQKNVLKNDFMRTSVGASQKQENDTQHAVQMLQFLRENEGKGTIMLLQFQQKFPEWQWSIAHFHDVLTRLGFLIFEDAKNQGEWFICV